jgi:hypothetical protein
MRILLLAFLLSVLFVVPLSSDAEEMARSPLRLTITPNPDPPITVENVLKEDQAFRQGVTDSLRPRMRPENLALPVPREGFATGRAYTNPTGLPGINVLFNRSCQNFIAADGSIGPWGQEFLEGMRAVDQREGTNCFGGGIDFGQRCPGFSNLSQSQKDHVWIWLWAATAQAESSCQTDAQVNGIYNPKYGRHNTADGLMQLEYRTETRNANARDTEFCPNNADSQAVRFQARCSAHIMAKAQCPGYLKNPNSYWLKMGRDKGTIWDLLKRHPLCGG